MRHKKKGKKFGRVKKKREALLRNLAQSLIIHRRIQVTPARAKEVRSFLEPKITKAKNNTLVNRRYLARYFNEKIVKMLFEQAKQLDRKGGYLRIIKLTKEKALVEIIS